MATKVEGWLRKSHAGRPLAESARRRYFVSAGYHVIYYENDKRTTTRGHFDLRNVVAIEDASASEAPNAVALTIAEGASTKRIAISFQGDPAARPRWLASWCSAIPRSGVPASLQQYVLPPLAAKLKSEYGSQRGVGSRRSLLGGAPPTVAVPATTKELSAVSASSCAADEASEGTYDTPRVPSCAGSRLEVAGRVPSTPPSAAPLAFEVVVPDSAVPGDRLQMTLPNGLEVQITIPPNASPGTALVFELPGSGEAAGGGGTLVGATGDTADAAGGAPDVSEGTAAGGGGEEGSDVPPRATSEAGATPPEPPPEPPAVPAPEGPSVAPADPSSAAPTAPPPQSPMSASPHAPRERQTAATTPNDSGRLKIAPAAEISSQVSDASAASPLRSPAGSPRSAAVPTTPTPPRTAEASGTDTGTPSPRTPQVVGVEGAEGGAPSAPSAASLEGDAAQPMGDAALPPVPARITSTEAATMTASVIAAASASSSSSSSTSGRDAAADTADAQAEPPTNAPSNAPSNAAVDAPAENDSEWRCAVM